MIWVTWRQHRIEALIGGLVLVLIIPLLLVTGLNLASAYQQTGVAACIAQHATCLGAKRAFQEYFYAGLVDIIWLNVLPLLVGMFVGAPLVARELEQGTYRLAWTQSITRLRWLAVKLSLLSSATLLAFVVLAILMTWWSSPVVSALGPWQTYDLQGPVLLAYALFALVLGITVGSLIRRSVPAMAITFAGFVLLRLTVEFLLRPYFLPPLSHTWPFGQPDPRSYVGDFVVNQGIVDRMGRQLSYNDVSQLCLSGVGAKGSLGPLQALAQCAHDRGSRGSDHLVDQTPHRLIEQLTLEY